MDINMFLEAKSELSWTENSRVWYVVGVAVLVPWICCGMENHVGQTMIQ